ncbi:MAG: rhodanese-like domain-containing protein [Campylobacteraceae bacterium]|nr:rhodanese-like domain-containing protein [Campylobacteraceae bacterium]
MNMKTQISHYENKLKYEIDSSDLFAAITNKEDIVIIDVRNKEAYDRSHIPSSINLYHQDMNENSTKDFNKNTLYITYCDGIGCNGSTKGALNMSKLGFKVKELMGGHDWWLRDGYETKGKEGQKASSISCAC